MQSQSIVALKSSALCWASAAEMQEPRAVAGRAQAEESELPRRPGSGSAWWQCLATPCTELPPLLVTSLFPSPGAGLGWDTSSTLFAATDLLFYLHIISCPTMSSPTFSLVHLRSCPTSIHIPIASSPTTPKSFGSLRSSLHPITFQLSSHTSPFILCPHSCPRDHHCSTWC